MKWMTLFAAICFCLWFLSELAGIIVWIMQVIEADLDVILGTGIMYLPKGIAASLASLSGAIFFLVLYSKQLKKK